MEEVRKMKEKNLAAKLLEDLLRGRVRTMIRSNIVTGELFSNRFSETLNRYINGLLSNEEVIQELLKLAKEMMDAEQQGNELGLSNEEKAFYDALTRPQAVKDFYTNDQLVELTKDLTDMLRKNRTIDWNRREAERANMRRLVKRLLKKYKYARGSRRRYEHRAEAVRTVGRESRCCINRASLQDSSFFIILFRVSSLFSLSLQNLKHKD